MTTFVHSLSSALLRPNGIVRYINTVMELQSNQGHDVIFVTDAKPTQHISANVILYSKETSEYIPNFRNNHVWLQIDHEISNQILQASQNINLNNCVVICHDLHSYLAYESHINNGVWIQHESDVLVPGPRASYLSDEYLNQQIEKVNTTSWNVGLTINSDAVSPKNKTYLPVPFSPRISSQNKTRGLLYIGDDSEQKGAREFMEISRRLGIKPTVITHNTDSNVFDGAETFSFTLDQKEQMYDLISQHRLAYIPSVNECLSLAALECMQYMPLVANNKFLCSRYLKPLGAITVDDSQVESTILELLKDDFVYDNTTFVNWCANAVKIWQLFE